MSGIAKPGQVIAIMGASGAGKTSLLNVLTCRNGDLKQTGDVKVNGVLIQDPQEISMISGYVQQDDVFIANLRVREHLIFQAMLRMQKTKAEKYKRVDEVLNDVKIFFAK